jgi:hypothetical protein
MNDNIIKYLEDISKYKLYNTSTILSYLVHNFNSIIIDDSSQNDIRTINLLINEDIIKITSAIIIDRDNLKKKEYIEIHYKNIVYDFIVNY